MRQGFAMLTVSLAALLYAAPEASAETRKSLGRFKTTYYWVTSEASFSGARTSPVYDKAGRVLGRYRSGFVKALTLEGTGVTLEGKTLNWMARTGGISRFAFVDAPFGLGNKGNPLVPFRSVATDPRVISHGSVLYIPEAVGAKLPDGSTHDGYFIAADTGGAIKGQHLDLFTGLGDRRDILTSAGVANLSYHDVYIVSGGPERPYLTDPGASSSDTPGWEDVPDEDEDDAPAEDDAPSDDRPLGSGTVTASALNVRKGPSTSHSILTSVRKGDTLPILESRDGWHRVKTPSGEGWVSGKHLELSAAAPQPENAGQGRVTASALNVRKGPSTSNSILTSVRKGDLLTILESRDGWHRVKTSSGEGWVSSKYVDLISSPGAAGALRGSGD